MCKLMHLQSKMSLFAIFDETVNDDGRVNTSMIASVCMSSTGFLNKVLSSVSCNEDLICLEISWCWKRQQWKIVTMDQSTIHSDSFEHWNVRLHLNRWSKSIPIINYCDMNMKLYLSAQLQGIVAVDFELMFPDQYDSRTLQLDQYDTGVCNLSN